MIKLINLLKEISNEQPTKGLVLPIGISGSGKSTWIRTLKNKNTVVISPDEIRKELTGSISDQSKNKEVFATAHERAAQALRDGKLVIFDATNTIAKFRKSLIQQLKSMAGVDFKTYYKLFDANPEVSKDRIRKDIENKKDRSNVPHDVIDRQYSQYLADIEDLEGMEPFD